MELFFIFTYLFLSLFVSLANGDCTQSALDNCTAIKPLSLANSSLATNVTAYCSLVHSYKSCLDGVSCNTNDSSTIRDQLLSKQTDVNATINSTCMSVSDTLCSFNAVSSCSYLMPSFNAMPNKPWNTTDFANFCSRVSAVGNCLGNFSCTSADNKTAFVPYQLLKGKLDAYQYMCNADVQSVYTANQACYLSAFSTLTASCQANLSSISTTDPCRYNNAVYSCVYMGMRNTCNEQAARLIADFNVKQYSLALKASIDCQLSVPYVSCNQSLFNNCSSVSPADLLASMSRAWSSDEYNRFCSVVQTNTQCINSVSCLSTDSDYANLQMAIGMSEMYQYMCTNEYRTVYTQSFTCLMTTGSASQSSCYNSSFPSDFSNISPAQICRAYNNQLRCMFDSIRPTCGETAARVVVSSTVISYRRSLGIIYKCNFDINSLTSYSTGSTLQISVALTALLLAWSSASILGVM